ncbi:MAG TPA: VWA domain-containing protein [Pyrinomonadaceae bacterium]
MKRVLSSILSAILISATIFAQKPQQQPPKQDDQEGDIVRITSQLIQVDTVVTDKNDQVIPDLKLDEFKIFDNGKKQDLQFLEFVSGDAGPRTEGTINVANRQEGTINVAGQKIDPEVERNLTAGDLRRVFAFVVDDLTIPYEDIITVRKMLTDFVDNKMREGDLVAIVRVIGGNGLLQQFTSDKQILRRAIAQINAQASPYSINGNMVSGEKIRGQLAQTVVDMGGPQAPADLNNSLDLDATEDGTVKGLRALSTLVTAGEIVDSMKLLPGRKNLMLLSGGLPLSEASQEQVTIGGAPVSLAEGRVYFGSTNVLMRQLTDKASRAGVVINTMDVRGLKAQRGVSRFTDPGNEATSALLGGMTGNARGGSFGRGPNEGTFDNLALDTISAHQGLQALADATGGVSVVNSDNFDEALDKVMARSSYYLLAYRPTEPFDGKFHKLEIKVSRPGAKIYNRVGYYATPDTPAKELTKEQAIIRAAKSPLAKRDVNLAGTLQYRFMPDNSADIDINLVIDANDLSFKKNADDKYHAEFDVVGFVVNSRGQTQGGFSQTITSSFSPEEYKQALLNGISFTGHAQLPPGQYQLRAVVREAETGHLGTVSKYLEVPDLTKKRLTMSSIFLYGVDLAQGNKATPIQLNALRQLQRKLDLRYAAVIYNPKLDNGKAQLTSQLIVSQAGKVLFKSPEQPVTGAVQNGQIGQVGQISLAKVRPGRYVLTLVITDALADKKTQTTVRSIDFNLVD